jgi:hypothetical protein
MRNGHVVMLLLVVYLACGTMTAAARQHLQFPSSTLSGDQLQVDYDYAVRQTLLAQAKPDPYLRMVVKPSLQSEWMVEVLEPSGKTTTIQLLTAQAPVWNGGKPAVQRSLMRTAVLSSETAETLRRIWVAMLYGVRFESVPRNGLDGITFHFAAFVEHEGILAGEVWSPADDPHLQALVRLGTTLRECVEISEHRRAPLNDQLRNEAKAFVHLLEKRR